MFIACGRQFLFAFVGEDTGKELEEKGIKSCISGRKSRNEPIKYDKRRYRRRNRIEIIFGRLKDCAVSPPATTAAQSPSYRR